MKTDELISWLRLYAYLHREKSVVRDNVNEAADRLEELDERVAIMMEGTEHEEVKSEE